MSLINATLVAQAIHFSIAFLLIKYFFLKPVYTQIEQENKRQESLITMVQSHQQAVAYKEQELTSQWHGLRNYFAAHMPAAKYADISLNTASDIQVQELEPKKINMAIKSASQEIIKKVNNVW